MKKLITALTDTGLLSLTPAITGCGETSTVKDQSEVKTLGRSTKITDEKTIRQTGDNLPPSGTTTPTPPKH